mgnify:CR=1 FL=1
MNSRLTIQDLAALLAERTGKDRNSAELFLREFIAIVSKGVFTDKIAKVKGLGSFKVVLVEKRESIHVNTGERFLIPAHYKFSFLPDKELRELVNKPFSFFETTELNENVDFTDLDVSAEIEEKEAEDESVEDIIPENISPIEEPEVLPAPENTDENEEEITDSSDVPEVPESSEEEVIPEDISSTEPEPPFESEPSPSEIVEPTAEKPVEEPEPIPLADDFSDTDYQFEDEEPSTSPWIKWVVAAGIVGIIVAGSTLLYLNRNFFLGPEIPTKALTGRSLPDQAVASVDTLQEPELNTEIEEDEDTITAELPAIAPEVPAETPEVLATVKIETGSRLTLISLEYYGSKIFWVYLYDYNKAVIKDPNNIPVGTEIQVPAPRLYGIDKHSRASIDKAAARQTEILAGNL